MKKESDIQRPRLNLLSNKFVERIIDEAEEVLEDIGIIIKTKEGLELLGDAGARIDRGKNIAYIPRKLVEDSLKSVPSSISFYDRKGDLHALLGGNDSFFNPGSSSIRIWDLDSGELRDPLTSDQINFVKLTNALRNFDMQTTGPYPTDVPIEISAQYRHFTCLRYGNKPIWGGLISKEGIPVTKDLLLAVRGSEEKLREKPLCMFPVSVTSPLRWDELAYCFLTQFAKYGIPSVLTGSGRCGLSSPIIMAGAVVQGTAELLSGVVMSQITCPGAPVIWGGMSAGGTLTTIAGSEVGKYLGIPTQGYWSSMAKCLDTQAGLESGISMSLFTLAGINLIKGAGTLNQFNIVSLEKLVIDNEICGMARHLAKGIAPRGERLAEDLFNGVLYEGIDFINSPITVKWLRQELFFSSPIISKLDEQTWIERGSLTAEQRARSEVKKILTTYESEPLDDNTDKELISIIKKCAAEYGMKELPV